MIVAAETSSYSDGKCIGESAAVGWDSVMPGNRDELDFDSKLVRLVCSRGFGGVCVNVGTGRGRSAAFLARTGKFRLMVAIDGWDENLRFFKGHAQSLSKRKVIVWGLPTFISTSRNVYFNPGKESGFLSEVAIGEDSVPAGANRLDEFSNVLPRVDFLWIDADNHEIEVIHSSRRFLQIHRPEICVRAPWGSWKIVDDELQLQGYRLLGRFGGDYSYYVPDGRRIAVFNAIVSILPGRWAGFLKRCWSKASLVMRSQARRHAPEIPEKTTDPFFRI